VLPEFTDTPRKKAEAYRAEFMEVAGQLPYSAEFEEVAIMDTVKAVGGHFVLPAGEPPAGKRFRSVACLANEWLLKYWDGPDRSLDATLFGFNPKLFLKVLGLACAEEHSLRPQREVPCPAGFWWGHSDYRDILSALFPEPLEKYYGDDLRVPLLRFGLTQETWSEELAALAPEQLFAEHVKVRLPYVPGVNPVLDLQLTLVLLARLGFPVPKEATPPPEHAPESIAD
jgi:hypothetical protein